MKKSKQYRTAMRSSSFFLNTTTPSTQHLWTETCMAAVAWLGGEKRPSWGLYTHLRCKRSVKEELRQFQVAKVLTVKVSVLVGLWTGSLANGCLTFSCSWSNFFSFFVFFFFSLFSIFFLLCDSYCFYVVTCCCCFVIVFCLIMIVVMITRFLFVYDY